MKTTTSTSAFLSIVLLSIASFSFAQNAAPFKMRYQSTIKGDMTIISNNITNRDDETGDANTPYNTIDNALLNDELNIGYIDIDSDETTFSSSAANLALTNATSKKVVYAGLYWSATYKYNAGFNRDEEGKYTAISNKRDAIKSIKIKLPNQEEYTDVSGQVVFDGNNSKVYKENAPYVVYADVTSLVSGLQNPNGTYTVANVRASQGKIEGGVSAGWSLFVVYEDPTMTEKFVASYDGFSNLLDNKAEISIRGFQTPESGNVKAKIASAALEGDANLNNDRLLFSATQNDVTSIENPFGDSNNFFNSAITDEDKNVASRFPNSQNTLGYDANIRSIENTDNAKINNDSREAVLKFKSTGDRCYVFFTAFNVEVRPEAVPYASVEVEATKAAVVSEKEQIETMLNSKVAVRTDKGLADAFEAGTISKAMSSSYEIMTANNEKIQIQAQTIANIKSGYFVVANVYSDSYFATKFMADLKKQGIKADSFINPDNNLQYVYISKTDNQQVAVDTQMANDGLAYAGETWILSVNNINDTIQRNSMLANEE
jgi:hypothetical protein